MEEEKNATVAIIGAGISGVKAAIDLTSVGIDVIMYEASNEVGGRIRSIQPDASGISYDMGPSWLHGGIQNPLFNIAQKLGLSLFEEGRTSRQLFTIDGELSLDEAGILGKTVELLSDKLILAASNPETKNMSLRMFLYKAAAELETEADSNTREHACQIIRELEFWNASSWETFPAHDSAIGVESDHPDLFLKDGCYQTIIEHLFGEITHDHFELRLNTPVQSVVLNTQGSYQINESGAVDFVLVTCAPSALRNNPIRFSPSLPLKLSNAIQQTTMAALGKFYLEFDECYWPENVHSFVTLANCSSGFDPRPWAQPLMFENLQARCNRPALLVLTSKPLTEYLESQSLESQIKYFEAVAHIFAKKGHKALPVKRIYGTTWTKNSWFDGSYSALTVGQNLDDVVLPFIGGAGKIRFAGEHTIIEGNGCAHAAYETGAREARCILEMIRAVV